MKSVYIPNMGIELVEGSVIVLAQFPDVPWMVCNGEYFFEEEERNGWYILSLKGKKRVFPLDKIQLEILEVLPYSDKETEVLQLISLPDIPNKGEEKPVPKPGVPGIKFTRDLYDELKSTMIVVPDIATRDKLAKDGILNGRIVKVVDAGGGTYRYFSWSDAEDDWVEVVMEVDIDALKRDIYNQIKESVDLRADQHPDGVMYIQLLIDEEVVSELSIKDLIDLGMFESADISRDAQDNLILTMNFTSDDTININVTKLNEMLDYDITEIISDASTHSELPTAKAVYDFQPQWVIIS